MTTLSLKIPEILERRVTGAAGRSGTSRSALVRRAIEAYLTRDDNGQPARGSCLALADGLIGSIEGPRDLSTNADHMKGFGK